MLLGLFLIYIYVKRKTVVILMKQRSNIDGYSSNGADIFLFKEKKVDLP